MAHRPIMNGISNPRISSCHDCNGLAFISHFRLRFFVRAAQTTWAGISASTRSEFPAAAHDDCPTQQQSLSPRAPPCHLSNDGHIWNDTAAAIPSLFTSGGDLTLAMGTSGGVGGELRYDRNTAKLYAPVFLMGRKTICGACRSSIALFASPALVGNSCSATTREYESSSLVTAANRKRRYQLTNYSSCVQAPFSRRCIVANDIGVGSCFVVPARMRGHLVGRRRRGGGPLERRNGC
jgi:hypothetical protein